MKLKRLNSNLKALNGLLESEDGAFLRLRIGVRRRMLWSRRGANCGDGSSGVPAADAERLAEAARARLGGAEEGEAGGMRLENRDD